MLIILNIIIYISSINGIVTKYNKKYSNMIGLDEKFFAYIQSVSLRKTLESITLDFRRNFTDISERELELDKVYDEIARENN